MINRTFIARTLAIMALLMGAIGFAFAQDEVETANSISGVFVQSAEAGSLIANSDDTFSLTLTGVNASTTWQYSAPDLSAGRMATNLVALFWGSNEGLTASAVLETEEMALELTLSNPDFNLETNTMTYTAVINEIYFTGDDVDAKAEAIAPEEFADASLFIVLDDTFFAGFNQGRELAGVRGPNTSKNCSQPSPVCNSLPVDTLNIR